MVDNEMKALSRAGHRKRVRGQLIRSGISTFADYQILEYLLFYGVPRKDTKAMAYQLMGKFGSFTGVLDANVSELMEVPGITYNAAVLLHSLPQICARYELKRLAGRRIYTCKQLVPFIRALSPLDKESMTVVCLDEDSNFMCSIDATDVGKKERVLINIKDTLAGAVESGATQVVLAHNHPSGNSAPSHNDIDSTKKLTRLFMDSSVSVLDHIIVTPTGAFSIFHNKEIE